MGKVELPEQRDPAPRQRCTAACARPGLQSSAGETRTLACERHVVPKAQDETHEACFQPPKSWKGQTTLGNVFMKLWMLLFLAPPATLEISQMATFLQMNTKRNETVSQKLSTFPGSGGW